MGTARCHYIARAAVGALVVEIAAAAAVTLGDPMPPCPSRSYTYACGRDAIAECRPRPRLGSGIGGVNASGSESGGGADGDSQWQWGTLDNGPTVSRFSPRIYAPGSVRPRRHAGGEVTSFGVDRIEIHPPAASAALVSDVGVPWMPITDVFFMIGAEEGGAYGRDPGSGANEHRSPQDHAGAWLSSAEIVTPTASHPAKIRSRKGSHTEVSFDALHAFACGVLLSSSGGSAVLSKGAELRVSSRGEIAFLGLGIEYAPCGPAHPSRTRSFEQLYRSSGPALLRGGLLLPSSAQPGRDGHGDQGAHDSYYYYEALFAVFTIALPLSIPASYMCLASRRRRKAQ